MAMKVIVNARIYPVDMLTQSFLQVAHGAKHSRRMENSARTLQCLVDFRP
jgi:hypothetical protein